MAEEDLIRALPESGVCEVGGEKVVLENPDPQKTDSEEEEE